MGGQDVNQAMGDVGVDGVLLFEVCSSGVEPAGAFGYPGP